MKKHKRMGRPLGSKNKAKAPFVTGRPIREMSIMVGFTEPDAFARAHAALGGRVSVPLADFLRYVKNNY